MCLKRWREWCLSLCKAWDEYYARHQTQTVFFSPLRKRLPLGSGGHWKQVSDERKFLWPWRKMPPLTLGTPPIDDKDTKSSKKEGKLRQCHLWNEEGSIGVARVNPILYIHPRIFGPITTKASAVSISERGMIMMAITDEVVGTEKTRLFQTITPCHPCYSSKPVLWNFPLCTHKSKWRYLHLSQRRPDRTPFCDWLDMVNARVRVFLHLLDIPLSIAALRAESSTRFICYIYERIYR